MNRRGQKAAEDLGWVSGDAEDFLDLTKEERRLVELRAALSRAVAGIREAQGLTRRQLARKLKESVGHVAAIETGGVGVSLDSMFLALFALDGTLVSLAEKPVIEIVPDSEYATRRSG